MKRALGPLVLIGAAVLIRSACDDRLSVRGSVLDPEGQPVAGAVIIATYPRRMHEEKKRVKVDDDGTFRISLLIPRAEMSLVPIRVSAPGYEAASVAVPRNQHHLLEVVLPPYGSGAQGSFTLEAD